MSHSWYGYSFLLYPFYNFLPLVHPQSFLSLYPCDWFLIPLQLFNLFRIIPGFSDPDAACVEFGVESFWKHSFLYCSQLMCECASCRLYQWLSARRSGAFSRASQDGKCKKKKKTVLQYFSSNFCQMFAFEKIKKYIVFFIVQPCKRALLFAFILFQIHWQLSLWCQNQSHQSERCRIMNGDVRYFRQNPLQPQQVWTIYNKHLIRLLLYRETQW